MHPQAKISVEGWQGEKKEKKSKEEKKEGGFCGLVDVAFPPHPRLLLFFFFLKVDHGGGV